MNARGSRTRLVLIAAAALGSLAALSLHRPMLTGTAWARGDDLAMATAWTVAAAASAWLFVTTAACVLALGIRRPDWARTLLPVLPAGVRRLVEIAIVSSCLALPTLHAAGAASAAPRTGGPRVVGVVIVDTPVVRAPAPTPPIAAEPVPRAAPAPRLTPPSAARHVVVKPGDNLWLLARAGIERWGAGAPIDGTPIDDASIAHYWREVIAANRSTLRSGDPSLIFPGEVVVLPPPNQVS